MWKLVTALGDISKLVTLAVSGLATLLRKLARRREVRGVEETTAEIKKDVDKAQDTGNVDDINRRFGF